jgi:hypothetical protein
MYLDTAGDLHLSNDNQHLYTGASDDLDIYFNGTTSSVFNTATGTGLSFQIAGSEKFRIGAADIDCEVQFRDTGTKVDLEAGGGGGGNDLAVTAVKTGAYTASTWDFVLCDTSGGAFTVTLPAASGNGDAQISIKLVTAGNTLTIDGNASETIDGATTVTLNAQYEALTMICDGSNWHIVG